MFRNWLALKFIQYARKLTTWGFTDDHLFWAETQQKAYVNNPDNPLEQDILDLCHTTEFPKGKTKDGWP